MDETAKKKLKVRVMMQAMLVGIEEIAKEDPAIQAQLKGWDRIIQYSVAPDGPDMHLVIQAGAVKALPGPNAKASATVRFADLDTAVRSSRASSTVRRRSCRARCNSPAT